jgi:sulfatase maturation enzyme AslB (radical SAM superfamily)
MMWEYAFPLDGPAELHNRHRKFYDNAPTYDKVEYWIKKLTDENYKHLNVLLS